MSAGYTSSLTSLLPVCCKSLAVRPGSDDCKHDVFATGLILITSAKLGEFWDDSAKETVHADFINPMRGYDEDSKTKQIDIFHHIY